MADKDDTGTPAAAEKPPIDIGLVDRLRDSFASYIDENDVQPAEGQQDIQVDVNFVRNHAGPLLASMLRDLTSSFMPKDLSFSVPAKDAKKNDEKVNVNFDFGQFLGTLFQGGQAGSADDAKKDDAKGGDE